VRVRCGQVYDEPHVGVVKHDVVGALGRHAVLLRLGAGPLGDEVAERQHLDVRERVQVLQVGVADDPDPDDTDADGAQRAYPPLVRNV
jgi:hypothetical protein